MFYVLSLLCFTVRVSICRMHSVENSRYECGLHGKFEYCIDDIPGCVIGCHCHPGYYFDTESKICEPNTKLTDHYRRPFIPEPTRVYAINTPIATALPTPTTKNGVDEIGKDTDELGDWLYNQFFKTIEAQVINKTSDKLPTRRRGEDPIQTGGGGFGGFRSGRKSNNFNTKRKARISVKKKGKKKKSKGNGLRRKLLRITEDDSLFDSDSDESDNDSSSNGDESSSSSSSSETSKERIKSSTDEREHGHKKVVIFNRRPRPPLPSFIILPSMDTPYYPPLGLPPPPVMPMYPMVPIPPMAPFLPFLEKISDNNTTTIKTLTSTVADTKRPTESTTIQTDDSNDTVVDLLRNKNERHEKSRSSRIVKPVIMRPEATLLVRSRNADPESQIRAKEVERLKLVQQLRSKLKMKHRTSPIPDSVLDALDEDLTSLNDVSPEQTLPSHNRRTQNERDAKLKDFKYLSELIHRVNFNDTKPNTLNDINENLKFLDKIPNIRRNYNPQKPKINFDEETTTPRRSHVQDPEATYFINLGRQIASVVRAANSKFNSSYNLPKNQNNEGNSMLSVLNENRYPSRSYWERSVRSPLIKLKSYFPGFNFYKENNNENNLFNLENAFKDFASTVHPMSLQELENILSILHKRPPETAIINNLAPLDTNEDILSANALNIETTETTFPEPLSYPQYTFQRRNLKNYNVIMEEPNRTNTTHYLESSNFDLPTGGGWMLQSQEIEPTRNKKQEISNLQPSTMKNASSNGIIYPNYHSKIIKEYLPIDRKISQNTRSLTTSDKNLLLLNGISDLKSISPKYSKSAHQYVDKPENRHGLYITYLEPDKNSKSPQKYLDITANNQDIASANPELPPKYQELPDSPNLLRKYTDLPVKHRELRIQSPSLLSEFHESYVLPANGLRNQTPLKYKVLSAKYPNLLTKSIELPGKQPELSKKNYDIYNISTNLSDTSARYPKMSETYSDSVNLTEHSRRLFDRTINYLSDSTIHDKKRLNFTPDAGAKQHYTFEGSYPVHMPSYKKTFSKLVKSPSYFHHELHHFDYFE